MPWTRPLLLFAACLAGCPVPPPRPDACLQPAMDSVRARWPNTESALEDRDVYGQAVWFWAHQRASVDGFGVVLATIENRPTVGIPGDVTARGRADAPSLLFFDQTADARARWPLIGMGYHFDFEPCARPKLECALPEDFFLHEAGYHLVPFGDGGMRVATPDDVLPGTTLDEAGCERVRREDLRARIGAVRHGRAWVTHVWFPPTSADGPPIWANEDPWERWRDAPDRVAVDGRPFFEQGACACDDSGAFDPPRRGCGR